MWAGLDYLRELNLASLLLRVVLAIVMGGIIGSERTDKNHPAGLRTHILVCLGSTMVMITSQYVSKYLHANVDITRMGAQVISGIGFLGAGTIIMNGGRVKGLTTAAGLWATACMGLAIGIGFYEGALIAGIAIFSVLIFLSNISVKLQTMSSQNDLLMLINTLAQLEEVSKQLSKLKIAVGNVEFMHSDNTGIAVLFSVKMPDRMKKKAAIDTLNQLDGVHVIETSIV